MADPFRLILSASHFLSMYNLISALIDIQSDLSMYAKTLPILASNRVMLPKSHWNGVRSTRPQRAAGAALRLTTQKDRGVLHGTIPSGGIRLTTEGGAKMAR
jgi:hypothetical protein